MAESRHTHNDTSSTDHSVQDCSLANLGMRASALSGSGQSEQFRPAIRFWLGDHDSRDASRLLFSDPLS